MVSESISKADAEFLQGNFEEARRLFADALTSLESDDGDRNELAVCLQKLGDTNYVLYRYDEAEQQFSRLHSVLKETEGKAPDIANTLLKLAKTKEKLDRLDDAEEAFQQASDFAQKALPADHFILSSIFSSYSALLQRTKRKPELALEMEKKLKAHPKTKTVETKVVQKEQKPYETSKKDDRRDGNSHKSAAASAQENLSAMKSKLQKSAKNRTVNDGEKKRKAKKSVPPSAGDGTALDAKSLKSEAARKGFLQKDKGKKDQESDERAKRERERLRRAMAVVREHSKPVETEAELETAAPELEQFAWNEHLIKVEEESKKDAQPTGLGRSFPSVKASRPTGRKQIAQIGKSLQSAKANFDTEGRLLADPESERIATFRVASGDSGQHSILQDWKDRKVEIEVETHWWESQRNVFMVLLGATILLVGVVFTLAFVLPDERNAYKDQSTHSFQSADRHLLLDFTEGHTCQWSDYASKTKATLAYYGGTWSDELKLIAGYFDSCDWAFEAPEGWRLEDGIILYAPSAPEVRVIDSMRAFATTAQLYYSKHNKYPHETLDFAPDDTYRNPFSDAREKLLFSNSIERGEIVVNGETELERKLENGARFPNEPKTAPGSICAFGMLTNPDFTQGDRGTWDCQSLFFHCYDRNRKVVGKSERGKAYLIELESGRDISAKAPPHRFLSAKEPRICLSTVAKPDRTAAILKYVVLIAALAIMGLVLRHYGIYPFAKQEKD